MNHGTNTCFQNLPRIKRNLFAFLVPFSLLSHLTAYMCGSLMMQIKLRLCQNHMMKKIYPFHVLHAWKALLPISDISLLSSNFHTLMGHE